MQFPLGSIRPNPFRAIERYPLVPGKIEKLRESIRTTGFWDNVVARIGESGAPELAYGHHRLEALRQEFNPDKAIGLIIRQLSDDSMLQVMVRENMEEWGISAAVEQESVRAVVLAYGEGRIHLPAPDAKTPRDRLRYAPSFMLAPDDPDANPDDRSPAYTSGTIAEYLGWKDEKVRHTLQALELIELEVLRPEHFAGLGSAHARALVTQTRRLSEPTGVIARALIREAQQAMQVIRSTTEAAEKDRARQLRAAALEQLLPLRREAKQAAADKATFLANALRTGTLAHAKADIFSAEKVPRGIMRRAQRVAKSADQKQADAAKSRERTATNQAVEEREFVRRFAEDVKWFRQGIEEVCAHSRASEANGRLIRTLAVTASQSLDRLDDWLKGAK